MPQPSFFRRFVYHNYRAYSGLQHWCQRRFTRAGWIAVMALGVTAIRGDTNLSVGYQAFTFLFFLVLAGLIGCYFSRVKISAQRMLPRIASVGTPMPYRVLVQNHSAHIIRGITLLENLEDTRPSLQEFTEIPEPEEARRSWLDRLDGYYRWRWLGGLKLNGQVQEKPITALPAQGKVELAMELLPKRRGMLHFQKLTVASPDPFGLFRRLIHVPLAQSVLILPKRYAVPNLALPGAMKYQVGGVALASSVGESEEFISLRDYRPGDPLRHIHWKSWAKTGKPIVKEFQDEFFVRHALILDTFWEHEFSDVFEEAVSVAASFACTLQTQDSLLDLLFVGPQAFCFTIGRGLAHLEQMLEILASVKVCRDKPFSALSQLVIQHGPAVSGCVCIFLAWDEERQNLVRYLQALQAPLRVLIITEDGQSEGWEPGPLRASPECFQVLEKSKIREGLAALAQPRP